MRRLLLVFFIFLQTLAAAEPVWYFTHLNTANSDLSYDGVSKITQDSRGFIWIGTFKGLNRYDGARFNVYYKETLGLDSDFIHSILEDSEGNIWVGTDAGLSRYIWKEDRFAPFNMESDKGTVIQNKVTCLYCDLHGKIWIVANYQGVFCYDPRSETLKNWSDEGNASPPFNTDRATISFRRIVEKGDGGFWISRYHDGLFTADEEFSSIREFEPVNAPAYFKGDEIEALFPLGNKLLIASNSHGISSISMLTMRVETLFPLPEGVSLVDATMEKERYIWLSTTNGTWRYDLQGEFPPFRIGPDNEDRFSIRGHYVFSTFVDRNSGLWIGTKDGGVNYSGAFHRNILKSYADNFSLLNGSVLTGMASDRAGRIWITTERSSLLCWHSSTGKLEKVAARGLPDALTFVLCDGPVLWLGSLNGLYRYCPGNGKLEFLGPLVRHGATDPRVYFAWKSAAGELYFSNTLGLFRYDRDRDRIQQLPEFDGAFVTSLCDGEGGRIWVSSYATGLFEWDPASGKILRAFRYGDGSGLPSDKISSVFRDSSGGIWVIGFSSGFARLEGDGFRVYDTRSLPSLPSNVYFSAVQDGFGALWFSSDVGLVRFNPERGDVAVFGEHNGLLDSKLSRSLLLLPSGDIAAGSDNGFVVIDPSALFIESPAPKVILSKMRVGGNSLRGNVDLMDKVSLKFSQNSFGFLFSLIGSGYSGGGRLRCKLDGYDSDWRDVSPAMSAYWFNVPPGNYRLLVCTSSNGSEWIENRRPLQISVSPRFIDSFWGIVLIALLFAAALGLSLRFISRRQRARLLDDEKARERLMEEEMIRSKMDFFSHIVHEIKTPLTLIRTPLQSVIGKKEMDEDARRDLEVMQSNTDYLTRLVNELLEFARVERKGYILNCAPLDLVELLDSTVFNYSEAASEKGISLTFRHSLKELKLNADRPAVSKILNNLLINALKYASTAIDLSLEAEAGAAVLVISNDGDPIPEEMREEVFKPFVSYEGGHGGTTNGFGIGLALARSLAQMHGGVLELLPSDKTAFRLTLPALPVSQGEAEKTEGEELPAESGDSRPVLLIVDDNGELRDFIARKMEASYSVLTANNSEEALALLEANDIDIMITDITMPGRDGLELCREVRSDPENSHLPIIVLSARVSVESKIKAMESGADLYIEKPFDLEYLRTSMRNILERRDLMRNALTSGMGETDVTLFGLPKRDEEFFRTFDGFIMEHLGNSELSNEMIADALCMSQSSMIRKIRKLLNTSPSNYIRSKRLGVAAKMLRDSHGNNITDICYAVGFTNASYFAKCFKEKFGVTPSEYSSS